MDLSDFDDSVVVDMDFEGFLEDDRGSVERQ